MSPRRTDGFSIFKRVNVLPRVPQVFGPLARHAVRPRLSSVILLRFLLCPHLLDPHHRPFRWPRRTLKHHHAPLHLSEIAHWPTPVRRRIISGTASSRKASAVDRS